MPKYQLIKPYTDSKIYECNDPIKCAKKFYNQLKSNNNNEHFFVIKDIDSQQTFTFEIGKKKQMAGGAPAVPGNAIREDVVPPPQPVEKAISLKEIVSRIENLEADVREIKGKEAQNQPKKTTGLFSQPNKESACAIQ